MARRVPGRKALKDVVVRKRVTIAWHPRIAVVRLGFLPNSAGGIEIDATISGPNRRDLIDRTCALLLSVIDPSGQPVCEWACARDEVMGGVGRIGSPDVLFQLREDVGVDFGVFDPSSRPGRDAPTRFRRPSPQAGSLRQARRPCRSCPGLARARRPRSPGDRRCSCVNVLLVNKFFRRRAGAETVFFDTAELLRGAGHTLCRSR